MEDLKLQLSCGSRSCARVTNSVLLCPGLSSFEAESLVPQNPLSPRQIGITFYPALWLPKMSVPYFTGTDGKWAELQGNPMVWLLVVI